MIYLDNAATSYLKPQNSIKAICDYLASPANPERGVNKASVGALSSVFDARIKVADFFGLADSSRVIWTSGATESLNICIAGLLKSSDHVITTYLEHNSVLRPLYKVGCEVAFTDGTLAEIKKAVKKNTKAVIVTHASNVTGEVQDISDIGKWARENKLLFVVDSAQSAGVLDINVQRDNIDFLCFAGHKGLLGPQGIGGICINSDVYVEPLKVGGTGVKSFSKTQPAEYPNHLEAGTLNVPGIVGLSASIDYIKEKDFDKIYKHELDLTNQFLGYLKGRGDIEIYQNHAKQRVGVVSFNIKGKDSAIVGDFLSQHDIAVRTGAMCAPLAMQYYNIPSCIRVSFGLNNTERDMQALITALDNCK